jgi:hypothetical protein
MIERSDALKEQIDSLVKSSEAGPHAALRAMIKLCNAYIKEMEPESQQMALHLSKSELENGLEKAGGLVETLESVIRDQAEIIAMLQLNDGEERTLQ